MDLYLLRLRQRPLLGAVVIIACLAVPVLATYFWSQNEPAAVDRLPRATELPAPNPRIIAHAAGEVRVPGVYDLPAMSRVSDLLDAAGGVLPGADLDQLNLAALVADGERVYVPAEGEISPQLSDVGDTGPVNVNQATVDQLQTLTGVGPSTAAAIVAFRDEHGAFVSLEGLLEVPGIGPAKLEQISPDAEAR